MTPFIIFIWSLALINIEGTLTELPKSIHASPSSSMCDCTVSQGDAFYSFPFFTSDESAVDFYGYNIPAGSSSNTGLETSNGMIMLLYENSLTAETSLILILDAANDGSGGDVDITFNCLPSSAFVAVSDDGGELSGSPPNIVGDFSWAPCCTDGGVIGGIGCGHTITINPDIGSGIDVFTLVSGDPTSPTYINLAEIDCPITINCGGVACCDEAIEIEADIQNATCIQSEDGAIDLLTVCTANPSFEWSNGATTEDLIDIAPGVYTVTITDDGGCMLSESYTVDNNIANPEPSIEGSSVFCIGVDDFINLSVDEVYDTYDWSTGDNMQTIDVFGEGTYDVTVTNLNGCIGTASIIIIEELSPEPEITGPTETCEGEGILLDAGVGYSSYTWSNGVTNQIIYVDQEGTYTVTVTNNAGCPGSTSSSIIVNPVPEVFILGESEICWGDTLILDAEEGSESYLWSTGENSQAIEIDEYGYYEVTVTNSYGCSNSAIIYVDLLDPPFPTIDGSNSLCSESTITLTTDLDYLDYEWSTGDDSQSISVSEAGFYTVTVTNNDGCEGIAEHEIIEGGSDTTLIFLSSCNPIDTGIFINQYENVFGCDSVEIVSIEYNLADSIFIFKQSCNPQDTGLFIQNDINQFGCDSLTFETVTLLSSDINNIELTSCMPQDTGTIMQFLTNESGCDSVVIIYTLLLLSDTTYQTKTTCDSLEVGMSQILEIAVNGCDSLVITSTSLLLSDTTYLTNTTCDILDVGMSEILETGVNGCDSLVITSTSLLLSDTTYQTNTTCDSLDVGMSEVLETADNGCDSLVITNTSLLPSFTTVVQEFTCDPNQVGTTEVILNAIFGCDSLVITQVMLLASDTTWNSFASCSPADTGLVLTVLTNQLGCDSIIYDQTDLLPSVECTLDLELLVDTISCAEIQGSLWITLFNGSPPYQYNWSDQNGNMGSGSFDQAGIPVEITALPPGFITIDIVGSGGFSISVDAIIFQPDDIEMDVLIYSDYNSYSISCFGSSDGMISVEGVSGGIPPYTYNWSMGSQSNQLTALTSGWYSVTVSDAIGCESIDSIFLESPEELQFEWSVTDADCFTNGLGSVSFEQLSGGVQPFLYSTNQIDWQIGPLFEDLDPGNYLLAIEDANGCQTSTTVNIILHDEPNVSLGADTIVKSGESIELEASSTIAFEDYEIIYWEGFDCSGCSSIIVTPTISSVYSIIVIDSLGCEARDEINVFVQEVNSVYVPNVFSPDFDGINDYFTIYGSKTLQSIHKLVIFDRWGQPVFSKSNFPANDPKQGWNGTHHGKVVNNGVFVYVLILEFEDGETIQITGDILVIR
jgi:gliding motility-associated-like protein